MLLIYQIFGTVKLGLTFFFLDLCLNTNIVIVGSTWFNSDRIFKHNMIASLFFHQRSLAKVLRNVTVGTLAAILTALPAAADQRLYFVYSPLSLSLKIESLETFAQEGVVNQELAYYMNLAGVNEGQKQAFREALLKQAEIDPVQLSRFLNSPMGEEVLTQMGNLIAIQGGRNGKYALRGAMVQAAFDKKEGLTLLNFLRHLAVNMQFNLENIFQVAAYLELLERATTDVVAEMKHLSSQAAQQNMSPNFANLPDIRQPGSYGVAPTQTLKLTDESRQREFDVLLIKPQQWRAGKTPVI
ncbi:MAG: alpha/beta hydrolase, partial [Cyanobacteria bacterium P01_G01_bin.49]